MQLYAGIIWVCRACPVQGRDVHGSLDAAQHDAATHAVWWHREHTMMEIADVELRLISQEEIHARQEAALDMPEAFAWAMVPPLEPEFEGQPPTPSQQIVCDVIGCAKTCKYRRWLRRGVGGMQRGC